MSIQSRTHLRDVSAGFIFGTLLFLFAFGSMGMIGQDIRKVEPVWESQTSREIFATEMAQRAAVSLKAWGGKENVKREATQEDLIRIGNLFIEAFTPAYNPDKLRLLGNFNQSELYLQALEKAISKQNEKSPIRRSDVAIFLFRLVSDLFEIEPPDESSNLYTDIPRYHYINLPIDTLEALGLHLGREVSVFGVEDHVALGWLTDLSMNLIKICESQVEGKPFSPLSKK